MAQGTLHPISGSRSASILKFSEALGSSLDLRLAFGRAIPVLRELLEADHVGLAISRPGSLYDYEWLTTNLPEAFLANYLELAPHDFVLKAVAPRPNEVLRDHNMLGRRELERNLVYQHANATAKIEQVMAVMLVHNQEWSSGLSLYRSRREPFSDADEELLQLLVPQVRNAVRNSREYAAAQRQSPLEDAMQHAGVGLIWLDAALREVNRTPTATQLLERYFTLAERNRSGVPDILLDALRTHLAHELPSRTPTPWRRQKGLGCLKARFVRVPETGHWSIILCATGVPAALEAKLTPRLLEITSCLLCGMSNEEIAERDGRALATIKQQVSDVYKRLGVPGRKGLIRLAHG